jgi:2-polyprenyl-3-methyl-5-hydroxy-6-metoxy-1,4-benzoquinol methylase
VRSRSVKATVYHAGLHVTEIGLLPAESRCPMCLATGARKSVLRVQANPDVHMLGCPWCGGFSASRLPTEKTLREYYRRYYDPSGPTVTFGDPVRFARHVIDQGGPFLCKADVSILDFGGGGGDLSRALASLMLDRGTVRVRIDLVDYNSSLGRTDAEHIAVRHHETLAEVAGQRYDLVLASAVLEHIPYPRQVLIDLLSAVRPGGMFYARTPSVVPLFRIFQFLHLPYDFTFPAHLHDFGQTFWEGILQFLDGDPASFHTLHSSPSMVETVFRRNPVRTAVAYLLKSPWYLFRRHYRLVGGWEVVIQRKAKVVDDVE